MGSKEARNKAMDVIHISKLVEQYMAAMRTVLSSNNSLSKSELDDINVSQKDNYIKTFDESRKSNNDAIVKELNSLLVQYLTSAFNEINEENGWRNFHKNVVNEAKTSYSKEMKNYFADNCFYSIENLNELNTNIRARIILEIKNTPKQRDENFDEYLTQLENFMDEEFKNFVEDNKIRRDSYENAIKVKSNELLETYDMEMEKVIQIADCESELSLRHIENKMAIMKELNSLDISNDKTIFVAHFEKFEKSIDKRLTGVIDLWNIQINEQKAIICELRKDVIEYYRKEMNKYYQNNSFIATEKLKRINEEIVKHTVSKFESMRGNMDLNEYEILIKNSLNVIFDEIKEKNDANTPTLIAIGIDLGTTNSCVAFFQPFNPNESVKVIESDSGSGKYTIPSVVAFNENGDEIVGELAKEEALNNHRNTIFSIKRLIGRQFDDINVQKDIRLWPFKVVDDGNNNPKISIKVNGSVMTYTAEDISAKILGKMKEMATRKLGYEVKNAVITVPAYFTESQKQATISAGAIAGLNVLKIINEPTAAAIAYQLNRGDDTESRNVLIYDFGGGTFDVSILVIDERKIEVKACGGDNHLGGDDIDNNIIEYCLEEFCAKTGQQIDESTEEGMKAITRLRTKCEKKKRQLSQIDSVKITITAFIGPEDLKVKLTREKFEELNYELFSKSIECVKVVLSDAKLSHQDIDDIVVVGGTTRIPLVRKMLSDLFDGKQLSNAINPDEAVAKGAAIHAAIVNGVEAQNLGHLRVLDVTPMTLGVKVKGGFMSKVIDRNTKIPCKYIKQYTTCYDYQREISIEVYEGEKEKVIENKHLGTFILQGIPSEFEGVPLIDVSFEVNDDGKLDVKAKIAGSDEEEGIQITKHSGILTDEQLQLFIAVNTTT